MNYNALCYMDIPKPPPFPMHCLVFINLLTFEPFVIFVLFIFLILELKSFHAFHIYKLLFQFGLL
jgi:hypothetical protein